MARFRALDAASDKNPEPDDGSGERPSRRRSAGAVSESRLPPFVPEIDLERYERVKKNTVRVADKRFVNESVETARRLVCRGVPCSVELDGIRLSVVARYLLFESDRMGQFDYRAAFRRSNVDRYLQVKSMGWTVKTARQMRTWLYIIGRIVHPREYPQAWAPLAEKPVRTRPISPERVRRLYMVAAALPAVHSRRLLLQLDLCYGAGARPRDLKELRGCDISETSWDGEPVALVRLANQSGGTRLVPVADPDASRRILAAAAERPIQYLMTIDGGTLGRNASNKAGEYLVRRGHEGFNAAELRHGWMVQMAQFVPAALLMQLADVKDVRILAEHQQLLPNYGVQHAVALIKENWQ